MSLLSSRPMHCGIDIILVMPLTRSLVTKPLRILHATQEDRTVALLIRS